MREVEVLDVRIKRNFTEKWDLKKNEIFHASLTAHSSTRDRSEVPVAIRNVISIYSTFYPSLNSLFLSLSLSFSCTPRLSSVGKSRLTVRRERERERQTDRQTEREREREKAPGTMYIRVCVGVCSMRFPYNIYT